MVRVSEVIRSTTDREELGVTDVHRKIDWYVLQTRQHQEAMVEHRLRRCETPVFLPRISVHVRAGRFRQRRIAPMFPGYLFVQTDLGLEWKSIRYTPGVRDFLRSDGLPHPLPEDILATLRERTGPAGVFDPPPRRFAPGARLRIEEGPLRGLDAIFEREMSGPERVAVLLAQMNLPARVILSSEQLVAV